MMRTAFKTLLSAAALSFVASSALAGPPVDTARGAAAGRPGTAAAAAAATAGVRPATPCPEHWKLVAGSQVPDGSYTCEPDTAWYQRQITCTGKTTGVNLPCAIGCMPVVE
jgi:hypothetical protein